MKNALFPVVCVTLTLILGACTSAPKRRGAQPVEDVRAPMHSPNVDAVQKIQSYYLSGQYDQALNLIELTPEEKIRLSDRAEFWNLKGLCHLAKKDPTSAEVAFKRAINENKNPDYLGYFQFNLAHTQFDSKQIDEALKTLLAIDLQKLDSSHQKKVSELKERGVFFKAQPENAAQNLANTATTGVLPPTTSNSNAIVTIPLPQDSYNGSTNTRRIGLLLPMSGKYESFGARAKRAIELAFQNDERGRTLELMIEDSGDSTASHLAALKKLVEEHEVIAVIGPLLSKDIEAVATQAAYYRIPLISMAQAQGIQGSHLFSCSISNRDQITRILDFAMNEKGLKKFAVIAPNNKSGEEMAHLFWDEVDARQGKITDFEMYSPSDTDFRAPVDKVLGLYYSEARKVELDALEAKRKELNITRKTMKTAQYFNLPPIVEFDAVFIPDDARTVGQIVPTFAYRDADNVTFLGISSWNSNQLLQRSGPAIEGAAFAVGYNNLAPGKSTQAFMDQFKLSYNIIPGEIEAVSYDTAMILLAASQDRPSSREDFRLALEMATSIEAATGIVQMNVAPSDHRCTRKVSLYQVEKGKFKTAPSSANRGRF